MVLVVLENFADDTLAIETIRRIQEIGVLPQSITNCFSIQASDEDLRMFFVHPRRDRIGGSAQNDLNACLVHSVDYAVHPCEFKAAIFRLPNSPTGFADANH